MPGEEDRRAAGGDALMLDPVPCLVRFAAVGAGIVPKRDAFQVIGTARRRLAVALLQRLRERHC